MTQVSDFFQPRRPHHETVAKATSVYAAVPHDQVPQTLVWDVTYHCNLKCVHCYNADKYGYGTDDYGRGFTILPSQPAKEVIDWAKRLGIVHVHMLGGEPLLRPDLPELIRYATAQGLSVTITSNGTLVTERLAEQIIEAGTEQVSVSLDGGTPATNDAIRGKGTFERILKGIRILCDVRDRVRPSFEVGISFTLTRLSLDEMPRVLEIGRENGVDVIVFQDLYDLGAATRQEQLSYTNAQATVAFEHLAAWVRDNPHASPRPVVQIDTHYPLFRWVWLL